MKQSPAKLTFAQRKPRLFLSLVALGFVVAVGLIWMVFGYFGNNAEKTAKPLERALIDAGAVKKCSRGDSGRGPDNREPRYSAIYEIPGNRKQASDLVLDAAKKVGFNLKRIASPSGAPNSAFFEDRSKPSTSDPESGNIQFLVTIFASSVYSSESQFCGVVDKGANAPSDSTTFDITLNLPAL